MSFTFDMFVRSISCFFTKILLFLIVLYQKIFSTFIRPKCRFTPSCSHYAAGCLHKYGLIKGIKKASWRLLRCNPFGGKGYDPP